MKPIIKVLSKGKPITVFTQHITYVEHTTNGAILHINAGGKNVAIDTGLSLKALLIMLGIS